MKRVLIILCWVLLILAFSSCNNTTYKELPPNDSNTEHIHEYRETIVSRPSCTEDGNIEYICECGQIYIEIIPKTNHNYGEWNIAQNVTEMETGVLTKICANDATHTVTFTLQKLSISNGYTYEVITPAKCESTGTGRYTYTKDGQDFTFDVTIVQLNHNYGEWAVTTDPTEGATGVLTKTCANDATHAETFILPKFSTSNGYTYEVIEAPKCVSAGIGRYTYIKEEQIFNFDVAIISTPHLYAEWEIVTSPTLTAQGEIKRYCSLGNHTEYETLPTLSIDNGYLYEIIKPSTNTSDGIGRYRIIKRDREFAFDVVIYANETEFDPR